MNFNVVDNENPQRLLRYQNIWSKVDSQVFEKLLKKPIRNSWCLSDKLKTRNSNIKAELNF